MSINLGIETNLTNHLVDKEMYSMKTCPQCGHMQTDGKFCGKCGTPLPEATITEDNSTETAATYQEAVHHEPTEPTPATSASAQPNEQIEKLKGESKQYLGFFLQQLKTPSAHLHHVQSGLKNSVISIILYIVLTGFAVYTMIRPFSDIGFGYVGPSFVSIIFYSALVTALILAIQVTAIFVTSKLFSENFSYTEAIRKVCGFLVLPIVLSAAALLLALISSYTVSGLVLYLGIVLAFGTAPMFVMITQLAQRTKSIDGFYAFLFYCAFVGIVGFFISLMIMDSAVGDVIDLMDGGF